MPGVDSGTKNSDAGTNSAVDRAGIRMGTLQKKKSKKEREKKEQEHSEETLNQSMAEAL